MSSMNIDQYIPVRMAQAIANPIFPVLDSQLRA
ncbi:MAG: chromosome partition protein MukE, partial [Plesiomonas shigelloides]